MCTNKINIINKAFFQTSSTAKILLVNCGKCPECKRQREKEWQYRSYWQSYDTCINNNGFIYFETLTYSNENLPTVKKQLKGTNIKLNDELDFSCFSREDIRNFHKRLRKRIEKETGIRKEAYKYLLVSEYGQDDRYTHRPHYHIIFYVNNPLINKIDFIQWINKAWGLGRTDLKNSKKHIIETNLQNTDNISLINYVSKYINKSSTFQKRIDNRVKAILEYNRTQNEREIIDEKYLRKLLNKHIQQFHTQSIEYGIEALKHIDESLLYKEGNVMRITNKGKFRMKLPKYYERKLFYTYNKIEDYEFWTITEKGILWKKGLEQTREQSIINNTKDTLKIKNVEIDENILKEYVKYVLYIRGREKQGKYQTFDEIMNDDSLRFCYLTKESKSIFGREIITTTYKGTPNVISIDNNIIPDDAITKHSHIAKGIKISCFEKIINMINKINEERDEQQKKDEILREIQHNRNINNGLKTKLL